MNYGDTDDRGLKLSEEITKNYDLRKKIRMLEAQVATAKATLKSYADHGLTMDLNPTHDLNEAEEFWHRYIRFADDNVKRWASETLEIMEKFEHK